MLIRILSGCHDVLMMSVNLKNIDFLNIYGVDHRCINSEISKGEAVWFLKISDLSVESGLL